MGNSINDKAEILLKNGNVVKCLETERRIHFTVISNEIHYVIYDKQKNEWSCDCKYYSIHSKECSHIRASSLLLKEKA